MKKKFSFIIYPILLLSLGIACTEVKKNNENTQNSEIIFEEYDNQDIQNLAVLCKVWGFLKYYHPAVTSGKYDWDKELIKILPRILNINNQEERDHLLIDWIKTLGPVNPSAAIDINPGTVKMFPDLDWTKNEKVLERGLILRLQEIVRAEKPKENHYVELASGIGNPIFINENEYATASYPDTDYRLLALFRYWNVIQYYYPYRYLISDNWDTVLSEFIPQFIETKNMLDYKLTLKKLIACINDSHAIIDDYELESLKGNFIVPVQLAYVENKVVVIDHFRANFIKNCPLQKGDVLTKVNNTTVDDLILREYAFTAGSNHVSKLRNILSNILRSHNNRISVTFEREGEIITDTIKTYHINSIKSFENMYQKNKPFFQYISDIDAVYLYFGSTMGGEFPDYITNKGLIIDLRGYPDSRKIKGYKNISYLYPKPTEFVKYTYGSIIHPGLFLFTKTFSTTSADNIYNGKVVILVNELTQSHVEFMAMKYRCSPNASVIGSQTSGADGNVSSIVLPGNIKTHISGIGIYYPDGTETQGIGIIPDIEVKPTIKGIREGRDEILEKAIEIIKQDRTN